MLNRWKNSSGAIARAALLAAAIAVFGSMPASATPLDATSLPSGSVDWILRAESDPFVLLSFMSIGTPPSGDSVTFEQGCPSRGVGSPACPATDFLIEIRNDTDGDPLTYAITFGARGGQLANNLEVSEFYTPTEIITGFGVDNWSIAADLPAAPLGLTGTLTLNAAPAIATTADIVLAPFSLDVTKGAITDTVSLDLATTGSRIISTAGCNPTINPVISGTSLNLATGEMELFGQVCVPDHGQYLSYRVLGSVVVPEPGTLLLAGSGLLGLAVSGRRRRS